MVEPEGAAKKMFSVPRRAAWPAATPA